MRYSIIIVAYRDFRSLQKCIDSIVSSGIKDYEAIVWNNTPREEQDCLGLNPYLKGYTIHSPDGNIGFAAGCNAAAAFAKGEILIFLNPDTQVFGNWADDMAKGIEGDCVAVGPISNFVAGFQKAEIWGGEDKGFAETRLLIGFCLMIRADIFKELGGMDENLFLGCDDLDLSWRIHLAGYKMAIATGVFVHHEGHTSMNMNPEKNRLIKESSNAFRAKLKSHYGDNVPTSEELWGCKIHATELKPMRLSVCMIVSPQDFDQIHKIFDSAHYFDEMVIVETFDGEPKKSYDENLKFFSFPWADDFAAARNFALSKCTGDWVLWLDADDRVSPESSELIRALIKNPGNNVALQACHFALRVENTSKDGSVRDSFFQPRLFPRLPGIEWGGLGGCKGLVHETYFEACQRIGLPMVQLNNVVITHTGYSDHDLEVKKAKRNLNLLLKEPDNAYKWYNVGCTYMVMGELDKSTEAFKTALGASADQDKNFIDNIRYNLAMSLHKNGGEVYDIIPYLTDNQKPDSKWLLGMLKVEIGETEEGCDLLWAYLKIGDVKDNMGTNCPIFRKAAVNTLTEIGVIKV